MKYAFILGTKAELIKTFPIMLEMSARNIPYLFIHTGQHNIVDLCVSLGVRAPDVVINSRDGFKGDTGLSIKWAVDTLFKLWKYLSKQKDIQFILVHGDTQSTFLGMCVTKLTGKKLVHIEAGLRSGNLLSPFPEDLVRNVVDAVSNIKFAPSEKSKNRLNGQVYNVGNTTFDSLDMALELGKFPKEQLQNPYAVATIHRHENIKSKDRMKQIVNILSDSKIPVYWFLHENTRAKLIEYDLMTDVTCSNIYLKEPLEYLQFIHVLKVAQFVFSDGGGVSCECAALEVPILLLRNETEREEYLNRWDQVLTKFDRDIARTAINRFSLPREKYVLENPYFNGVSASKQIVNILEELS